jgi:hypothetical protein
MALIEKPSLFGVALQGRRYSLGKRDALWHKKRTSARVDFRAVQKVRQQGPSQKKKSHKGSVFEITQTVHVHECKRDEPRVVLNSSSCPAPSLLEQL